MVPEPQDADQYVVDPDVDVADPVERPEAAGPRLHAVLGAIAVGGVVGAEARYGLGVLLPHRADEWPWATLLTNVSGCLLIGVLMVVIVERIRPHPLVRPLLGVGVLGGYTTFSTYAVDTVAAVQAGRAVPGGALRRGHPAAGAGRGRDRHDRDPPAGARSARRGAVMTVLWVALGAAVGAPLRYLTDRAVQRMHRSVLPWGTFTVNVVGSFVLGALTGAGASSTVTTLVGTGFCGALTTYSTFAYETLGLAERRAVGAAVANLAGSVAAGVAAALLGWLSARALI